MPPPSVRSIARQLGVSAATVSLALRDSSRVMPATKQRVLRAAKRVGYRVNPLIGSMMAEMRRTSHGAFQGSLIALNTSEDAQPALSHYHRQIFSGAQRRAHDLGYSLELCWIGPHALSLVRINTIVRARNVAGTVVLPFAETQDFSAIDWSRLAGVMLDHCLSSPVLHTVLPDHQLSMFAALERLLARGYRRPGLVLVRPRDARVKYKWSAGFSSFSHGRRLESPVPVLLEDRVTREDFLRWFHQHRPDVVIGHLQDEVELWLADQGLHIPRDVGFVQLNWTERTAPCAGLDLQPALLGAAAVESVVAQLHRNEQGPPAHPKTIALAARWVEGPTLRPPAGATGRRGVRRSPPGSR